jgi:predicted nucleotidyltransferase
MKTKEEIIEILEMELPYLRSRFKVAKLGLFGSYARNEQTPNSDVDILVEFEETIDLLEFVALRDYLSQKLGLKVDLATPKCLKPLIKPIIMREVVYVKNNA